MQTCFGLVASCIMKGQLRCVEGDIVSCTNRRSKGLEMIQAKIPRIRNVTLSAHNHCRENLKFQAMWVGTLGY